MKSPLRWVGGKSKLATKLIGLFPAGYQKMGYVEGCSGAAWLLCAKQTSKWEVLNDYDHELMNFFRVIKEVPYTLIEQFDLDLISREYFDKLKLSYKVRFESDESLRFRSKFYERIEYGDIERAHDFFYLNQVGFGGDMRNPVFGAAKEKSRFKLADAAEEIDLLHKRLMEVTVECLDFEKLIGKYDSKNTFFYFDPPYINTKGYATAFGMSDHVRLADSLRGIDGKFMLTINGCQEARELYEGFNIIDHEVYYSQCKDQSGRAAFDELIILNY